jgi:hypothetical protein
MAKTRIVALHTTPCGLKKQCAYREREAYALNCKQNCVDPDSPFTYDDAQKTKCVTFQARHGWRPTRHTPSASFVGQPAPLPGQLEFFSTLTDEKNERS